MVEHGPAHNTESWRDCDLSPIASLSDKSGTFAPGPPITYTCGPLAQLVERYIRIVEVTGSSPVRSTKTNLRAWQLFYILDRQAEFLSLFYTLI